MRALALFLLATMSGGEEVSDEQKARQIFDHFDVDDSGGLDAREQKTVAQQMGGASKSDITPDKLMEVFKLVDADKDGIVKFDEFNRGFSGQIKDDGEATTDAEKTKQIFEAMDEDHSGTLDKKEQKKLADKMGSIGKMNSKKMQLLLSAMDSNKDGKIDALEFSNGFEGKMNEADAMKMLFSEEEVEYTAVDGTKKKIGRDELLKKMKEQEQTMGHVGGKVPKADSGKLKLDEIAEKNPQLYRLILMGRFGLSLLQRQGEAPGVLAGLSSKDDGEDEKEHQLVRDDAPDMKGPLHLVLTVQPEGGEEEKGGGKNAKTKTKRAGSGTPQKFEVHIARNPELYAKPHLAVVAAWELDAKGKEKKREIKVPLPPPPLTPAMETLHRFAVYMANSTVRYSVIAVGCVCMVTGVLLLLLDSSGSATTEQETENSKEEDGGSKTKKAPKPDQEEENSTITPEERKKRL